MRKYTQEQLLFLWLGYRELQVPELTVAFNESFNSDKSRLAIKSALTNHGFVCCRKGNGQTGKYKYLNDEHVEFIKREYVNLSVKDLTAALNKKFNLTLKVSQIKYFVHNHKIDSGRTGHFSKGHMPWNTGTKGVCKPSSTSFKKGHVPANLKTFGDERICSKDGYVLVKVDEVNPYTGYRGWYRPKHHVVWEQHNAPIPDDMILRFKDGDKLNCDISNLELVSRALHLHLNRKNHAEQPDELKPAVRAIAELEVATFAKRKEVANG